MFNNTHFQWARDNYLRLYPQCLIETYVKHKQVNGRKRKSYIPYVEIIIEINGSSKRIADLPHLHEFLEDGWKFQQGEEVYEVIEKLYEFYYERAHDRANS